MNRKQHRWRYYCIIVSIFQIYISPMIISFTNGTGYFFQKFGNLCKVYAHSEDKDKKQTRENVIRKEQVSTEDLERTLFDCIWNTHYDNSNRASTVDLECVQLIEIGMSVLSTDDGQPNVFVDCNPEDRKQSNEMVHRAERVVCKFLAGIPGISIEDWGDEGTQRDNHATSGLRAGWCKSDHLLFSHGAK